MQHFVHRWSQVCGSMNFGVDPNTDLDPQIHASLDSQFNINLLRFASIFKFFNINMFASLRISKSIFKLSNEFASLLYRKKHHYRSF